MPLPSRMPAPDLRPRHVFYLHGFASSPKSTKVGYFSERLREHGIDVRCPDFNQPDFATLTITRMLDQLGAELAPLDGAPATLFGSSLGGTLAILAAERFAAQVDRLVLMAPAVMFAKPGHHLLPPEQIDEWRRRGALPFFHYADNAERAAQFRVLRGQPALRRLQRRRPPADADLSGAARRVGRSPHGRGVREDAAERHAVAARRRSSADRQPAADVDRHPRVSRARRMTRARALAIALAVGFGVQGSGFKVRSGFGVQGSNQNGEPEPTSCASASLNPGGGYSVSELPMETYVARVLAGEAVRDSQPAALEALAITIRTFALANRGRHRADGFDLCDQTHCQVLRRGGRRDRARGAGHRGPAAAARRRAGVGLLLGVVRRPHAAAVRRLARRRRSAVPAVEGRRRVSGGAGVDRGAARNGSAARAAGVGLSRRAARSQDRVAQRLGPGRAAEARRPEAGSDLRPGLARRGRADARLAARQEHGVRAAQEGRVVPVQRPRLGPRRRHVRHRLGAARRARHQRRRDPRALYFPGLEISGGAPEADR